METSEAPIAIDEVVAGVKNGTITDMIACGTAAVVIGIKRLMFEDGSSLELPGAVPAAATTKLYNALRRHPVRPQRRSPRLGARGLPGRGSATR